MDPVATRLAKSFREVRDRFRHGELWELWFLALILITLIGILSHPLSFSRRSLNDFRPGDDPYDTHPPNSDPSAEGRDIQGF